RSLFKIIKDNVTVKHMIGAFIPQCDEEGHYRPLQCHPSTGYCWCVDCMGREIAGTNTPPGTKTPNCKAAGKTVALHFSGNKIQYNYRFLKLVSCYTYEFD
uniref:Thyroglobulin type-1 domain-containing protein n=1 Tax=Electrophorus electricus TaxID=8005 RepID=A0AAY5EZW4_ELEEL